MSYTENGQIKDCLNCRYGHGEPKEPCLTCEYYDEEHGTEFNWESELKYEEKSRDDVSFLRVWDKLFYSICVFFDWVEHRIWREKND